MVWQAGQSLYRNRYTVQGKLGSGGFGITYLVKDGKGREWVVKTLKDEVMTSEEHTDYRDKYLRDFQAETLRLAICRHRHIVQIENSFIHEDFPCILMEYVRGIDLWKRLKQQGALPEAEAVRYIQQIGEALIVVHDKGLLHRDLKPQNIMVRPGQDEAVLIDFGIAREFVPDLTQTHTFALTPGFAPIEQYDEQAHRGEYTDVYALAATLATLVTGSVPPPSFMRAVKDRFQVPTGVSAAVQKAIKQGMAVQPEDRPQSVEAWLELWQVSTPKVQTPARYQELEKLLQLGDLQGTDQETPFNRGNSLLDLGSYEEAIASYDKALEIKPDNHQAWFGRGVALGNLGRYEEAIASFDKALEIKSDDHQAWNNWGVALLNLGRNEEAITSYDKALEIKPDFHHAWNGRGYALEKLGRNEEAIASYDKALEIKPDFHDAWNGRGYALEKLGRNEEAIASYDKALEIKPDFHDAWNGRGYALLNLGRNEEAIASYDKALKIKPDFHDAWNGRGNTLLNLGRNEEALTSYDKALKIKPDFHHAWNGRGNTLLNLGRNEEAITSYDKALKIKPDYHHAWNGRGNTLLNLGRNEEAIAYYDKALEIKPDYHYAWSNRGIALGNLGRNEEAIACYDKALKIKPDDHDARKNRDIVLRKLGRN